MEDPVLVVGGDYDFINDVFRTKLAPHGIRIGWIWPRRTTPTYTMPEGCGGVIIIKSAIGHTMDHLASSMARDAGVQVVHCQHKFSQALPILRAVGMAAPEHNGEGQPKPSREERYNLVLSYLLQELERGRRPSRGELRGVVKRAFGPHVSIYDEDIQNARSIAAAQHTTHGGEMPPAAPVAEPAPKSDHHLDEWITLLIEERPEAKVGEIADRLRELTVGGLPENGGLQAKIQEVASREREIWALHHNSMGHEKRQAVQKMRWEWAKRFLLAYEAEHGDFTCYTELRQESERVLVRPIHPTMIKAVKDEIMEERAAPAAPVDPTPPPEDEPVEDTTPDETPTLATKRRYTALRVDEAAKFVKAWHKALTPPEAAMLHDWALRVMRNPRRVRTSANVKDQFVTFRRKPLEFAGAFLMIMPKGLKTTRWIVRCAYDKVMGVKLDLAIVTIIAEGLRLTNRLTEKLETPDEPEPIEGFFQSLTDAHSYYLSHATGRITREQFRKLLRDGDIEAQRESTGKYAPWLVSHAAVDEYLREHALGEAPPANPPQAPPVEEHGQYEALEALEAHVDAEFSKLRIEMQDAARVEELMRADLRHEVKELTEAFSTLSEQSTEKVERLVETLQAALKQRAEWEREARALAGERVELTAKLDGLARQHKETLKALNASAGSAETLASHDRRLNVLEEVMETHAAAINANADGLADLDTPLEGGQATTGALSEGMTVGEMVRMAMEKGYKFTLTP